MIKKVKLLQGVMREQPEEFLEDIMSMLKHETYLPGSHLAILMIHPPTHLSRWWLVIPNHQSPTNQTIYLPTHLTTLPPCHPWWQNKRV